MMISMSLRTVLVLAILQVILPLQNDTQLELGVQSRIVEQGHPYFSFQRSLPFIVITGWVEVIRRRQLTRAMHTLALVILCQDI